MNAAAPQRADADRSGSALNAALRRPRRPIRSLEDLRLTPEEYGALRRQGFVRQERRGPGGRYYSLCYRLAGRQCKRYIGRDPAAAERVRGELNELQRECRANRRLKLLRARVNAFFSRLAATPRSLADRTGAVFPRPRSAPPAPHDAERRRAAEFGACAGCCCLF